MLAFHVLSRGGFGVRLAWSGHQEVDESDPVVNELPKKRSVQPKKTTMRFGEAMLCVVENMKEIFVFPNWVLSMFLYGVERRLY